MSAISSKRTFGTPVALAIAYLLGGDVANAFSLEGTVWQSESKQCGVDPRLLYALALVESKSYSGKVVSPNPLALNIQNQGFHPSTRKEAEALLNSAVSSSQKIAVGAMQISLRWNGHRVKSPADLLDLSTNVRVGTKIFCEMIAEQNGDLALAIGRYHTPNPELQSVARAYGNSVIKIWRRLIILSQKESN